MSKANSNKPRLDAKTKKFINTLKMQNSAPIYTLSYEDARKVLLSAQSNPKISKDLDCEIKDMVFEVGLTKDIEVRFYKPLKNNRKLPLVVYYHGGGWVMGDKKTHERLVREICVKSEVCVLFVNYSPSPEAQYPIPTEQAYAALEYVITNHIIYGIDPNKVIVCGDSVGGNMSAVVTLIAKQRGGPKINHQILIYPVTDAKMNSQSYKDFAEGPWLTKKAMEYFFDAYAPNKSDRKDIMISPLNTSIKNLANLPSALVITAENDVLRDEGEAYAQKLMDAGVDVVSVRYNGTIHDFMMLEALANTNPAVAAVDLVINTIRKVFEIK